MLEEPRLQTTDRQRANRYSKISYVPRVTSLDDRPTTRESILKNNKFFFRDSQPTDNARVGIGKTTESSYVTADRQRAKTSIFRPTPPSLGIRPEELGLT